MDARFFGILMGNRGPSVDHQGLGMDEKHGLIVRQSIMNCVACSTGFLVFVIVDAEQNVGMIHQIPISGMVAPGKISGT